LQFALRHPDRCLGLILLAPSVSCEPLPPGGYQDAVRRIPARDVLAWGLSGPLFERVATSFIPDLDRTDARQIELAKGILVSVLFPAEGREPGIRNDVEQRDFPAIDSWPLERIAAPTLLIHGDADENSAYAGSVRVAARVPNAKLVTLAGADHNMIITRHAEIQAHIGGFLEGIAAQRVSSITAPAR
jgi:pimeloyl-ACP methyl ester carboxylesterase